MKNRLHDLGFSHVWNNHSTFTLVAKINLKKDVSFWKQRMLGDETIKNLRTYRLLKKNFGLELYLEYLHDKHVRKCVCSLRNSAHRLRTERGRYLGEKPEDRLCNTCNAIEDEMNFFCVNVKSIQVKGKYFMIVLKIQTFFQV